ncbi:hypothetical protein WJX82_002690 [Trebouxia sp. C0006]
MFEQYISDWLTSYLGHFLDIKRENLRANILSAFSEPAGLTLKNVKLKTEALDFFQLPVAVEEAVVGSLHVRCPWGFRGRNVIELSDVFICVSPRPEADWEEGPAKRRAYATKRAQLSAAEASRQLTGASSGQKSGYGWSFLTWSGSILLNKLQFRMKRTHICFKVQESSGQGKGTEFGMHLGLVETGYDDQKIKIKMKESGTVKQAAKVLKDISVQQLSVYWQASNPEQPPSTPTGWRSDAAAAVTPRLLWQYAIQAVLQDLGQHHPRKLTGATLLEWRDQRQRYVELWTHHLQSVKGSSDQAKQEQEQAQIEALEMKLLVPDILLFRLLASRALKRRPSQQGSHIPLLSESSSAAASKDSSVQVLLEAVKDLGSPKEAGSPKEGQSKEADSPPESCSRQGWWTWGLSGVSSILGYVPSKEHPQTLPLRPSQAEMQELFATLSLDPNNLPDGRDPSRKLEVIADVKIASGSVNLSDAVRGAQAKQLASIDLEQLKVYVQLRSEATHAKMTVQEITVQDLGTGAANGADVVLARWQQPGSGSSIESVEHATARSSGSISLSSSFVVVPELLSEPPVLKMQFDHKADDSPKLEVWVQALHVSHRPTCWAALSALTAAGPKDTQSSRVTDTANLLNDSKAQTLAQAQRAIKAFMLPTVAVKVEDVVVLMSQHGQPASEGCSIVHTGAIQITHEPEAGQLVQQQHLVQQLQQHCIRQKSLSKEALQELLTQVQTKVLYQRLCVTLDAVQLSTGNRLSDLSPAGTTVLSPCRCTAYLDLHRASGDALLPQLKALVELDRVQVHLTPASMATLQSSLLQSSGPADAEQLHSEAEQTGQPLAEVNVTAGIVSMAFDDRQSQDADARNTHLKLRGQKLNLLLEVMQDAIATKATLLQLHASDRSQYISKNPKIYGMYSVPRLAQVMSIDSLTVRVDHSQADGLLVSGRLMGATAKGWPGESGSMISRLTSKTPAQAEFTVYNTVDRLQTSITLQDGCFGTATLMRIAALFMPSPTPASLTTSQASANTGAATVADSDRLTFEQHAEGNLTSFGTDGLQVQAGNESAFGLNPEEEVEPKSERKEQFSLEIVRCKIVCPAKVNTNAFSDADPSPLDHTLYMEIPHFILQLPVSQPAQHPHPHPVDLNVRHVLNRHQPAVPAPDAVAPSPFASNDQQGTIFSVTNLTLYVALPEEFDLPESVTSSSEAQTQLPPFLSIPTASLIAVPPRPPPQHAFLRCQLPHQDVPTFELEMKTAERHVPVIRHRSVFMSPAPPTPYADAPDLSTFTSAASSFDLSFAPSIPSRQALPVYHDAPDRLGSSLPDEDMPTSPWGTPLPEGWSPDMLPAGDRLLLLLGSKECFAASDGIASSSTDASIGCSLLPAANDADIPLQSALEICASDMMLRVYLEGWQLLIHTSYESIEAVMKGQQQPHQQASSTQPSQHDPSQLAMSRSMGSLAAAAQGLSIQLHATEVVAELVGNIFPGENALSPCISVRTAITIDSHATAGGQLQHCLAVPRLAVATALMELPPDIRSMVSRFEGGVLMGALDFQATLTLPIVASGGIPPAENGLSLQLEEHTTHPQQQLEAPVLAEGLLLAARPRTTTLPVEVAPTPKAQSMLSFETLLKTRYVYNTGLMGWEPLLEPWTSSLTVSMPLTRQGGREDTQLEAQQLSVTLKTQNTLELTFTQAVVSCYQAAQGVLNDVALVAAEPTTLEDVILSDDGNLSPGGEALYWLQNLTDMPLQFWSSGPGQSKRTVPFAFEPSDLGEGCLVSPGESESVIPLDVDKIICKGHHVADPQVFLTSASTGDAQAASSSADDAASFPTSEEVRSHRQAGLKVLVRLQGQGAGEQPLGPWALDMEQKSMKEVQLCAPAAQSAPQSFKVYCQVARGVRGGAGLTIHSGIRLHNNCGVLLSIGMQQRWLGGVSQEGESARTTKLVAAGDSIWLPALCCKASYLSLQPADDAHHWCPGVPLLQLLHQAEYAFPSSHCQNLVCSPVDNRSYAAYFCLGAAAVPHSQGYTLVVKAPIELYNALPMPLTVALSSTDPDRSSLPERMLVQPLQSLLLHQMGAFHHLDKVALEPSGYCLSSAMGLPHGPSPRNGSDYFGLEVMGKAGVQVHKHRREDGSASLLLCHCYDPASGAHALRVSCSLWVFNCTGLPIALRQSWLLETFTSQDLLRGDAQVDAVPTAWVPPYRGSSQHPLPAPSITRRNRSSDPYHTPTQSSQSSSMAGRMSSRFNLSGLGEVLTPASVHSQWGAMQQSSIGSNPKGLSDTGQVAVMHQTPTRYASMQGDVEAHRQKVRLQLCATTATSHSGKAFWSDSVQLDALGGAAVVEAPCPMTGGTSSQKEGQAGYRLAVTAVQIPDGDGALALHVMPRYMLHNNLQAGVQYKQQGQSVERDLLPGGARAMHWPDVTKPKLRLCLRLHEAGWLWSGGFALDTPGDLFVKIRHREQEVTRLVRVDVSTSANGVLAVALSEQEKGFAPYRLDNCTGLKLHLRQKGCIEQDDLLRPYSSLDYAWDEPALPHQLVLELPGNRRLGTYDLDRVGSHYIVTLAATAHRAEQRIQVCVRADGPKRVLQLIDLLVHVQPTTAQQELVRSQLGWKPWSGTLHPGPASRAASCGPALAGVSLEIQVQVGGLGVSVVGDGEELLYGRISGIQLRAVTGVARQTLELAIQQVQVDNPLQNAAYPIMLTSPNAQSSYGVVATAVAAAATAAIPKPAALCLRWSVWRTRPGHVLCVERLEMQTAPLLLEVEQAHAMQLMQFGRSLLAPFADASHAVRQRTPHEPDLMVLRAGGRQRVGGDKVYIEYLHVNKLQITLSFLPSPGVSRGYQWFISVAGEVEGGYLGLAPLQLHHPLLGRQALVQLVHSHYMRAALPGLINMLGSSNVLGSPLSVIHHLQLGVWSFLASPAQGLKESTQGGGLNLPRLVDGFVEGSRSLASNVVLAVSTATAKTTNAARKGLINLGLDKLEATAVPLRQRLQLAGSSAAASPSGSGFLPAVAEGLTGFVREPVRGVRQHGLAGLPFGVMRGSLGLFGHPLGSLLGTAASLSSSIRNSLLGFAMLPPRLRPPRHVSSREPLSLYNYVNALGRGLLRTIEGGKYLNEGFVACHQLSVSTGFVIITRVHILAPELNLLQSQQLLAQKTLGLRLSARLPWQAYTATFQSASDAAEILRLVHQGREQVCLYGLLPVQRGGVLDGSWWQGTMLHEKSMQQAITIDLRRATGV